MYIRKVIKRSKNKERAVYRLVESYRTPSGPRQRRLLTLKDFTLEEKYWKQLADAIEAKLKGQIDPRQGWVISENPLLIQGESGVVYECEGEPRLVINPPSIKKITGLAHLRRN